MIYCGIDPGLHGAIAFYDHIVGKIVDAYDVPLKKVQGRKPVIDYTHLAEKFFGCSTGIDRGIIEQVNAMPGQGVTSMFRFGEAYGALTMMLETAALEYIKVPPQKWKKALKLEGLDKEAVVRRALDLFPSSAPAYLKRKKDHNRAEAMLLAYYAAVFT